MRGANKRAAERQNPASANLGFEAQLWQAANALRGSIDVAEYNHVVLGLVFFKYISDAFEEHHQELEAERAEGADPEDPDEYRAFNVLQKPVGTTQAKRPPAEHRPDRG
ncbi:hypothetical protein HRbin36_00421 [bacterium HR36]|nr:hypothetical protein HRbin36_00421 [bacterium HR36]